MFFHRLKPGKPFVRMISAFLLCAAVLMSAGPALGQGNPTGGAGGTGAAGSGGAASSQTPAPEDTEDTIPSLAGNALGGVSSALGTPALAIVVSALWVLQSILTWLVTGSGYILDYMLDLNTKIVPSQIEAVQTGWKTTRDIGNSFFLLIILWIAFTIIFNLENYGGKKLLTRVLIIAFFLNFSMVMVSASFGLSNVFAETFSKKLPRQDKPGKPLAVSAFVVGALQLQTIDKVVTQAEVDKIKEQAKRQSTTADLATIGGQAAAGCALGAALGAGIGCGVGALAGPIISAVFGSALTSIVAKLYARALILGIGSIFLALVTAVFSVGAFTLLFRIVAMVLLSVLAPAALLTFIIPGGYGRRYFGMWKDSLIKWTTFTPIFYFLLYIALFLVEEYHKAASKSAFFGTNIVGNMDAFLMAAIVCTFLIAAIKIARKTGDAVSKTLEGYAKTLGGFALGAATGGAAAALTPLAARALKPEGTISTGIARITGVVPGAKPAARAVAKFNAKQRADIEAKQRETAGLTTRQRVREFDTALLDKSAAAPLKEIIAKKELKELKGDQLQKALLVAEKFGFAEEILKQRPDLATAKNMRTATDTEAIDAILKKISAQEVRDIRPEAYTNNLVKERMAQVFTPSHIEQIARTDIDLANQVLASVSTRDLKPENYQWATTVPAQVLGINPSTFMLGHQRPEAIVRREVIEIQNEIKRTEERIRERGEQAIELQNTYQETGNANFRNQAIRAGKADIPSLRRKIERHYQDIQRLTGTPPPRPPTITPDSIGSVPIADAATNFSYNIGTLGGVTGTPPITWDIEQPSGLNLHISPAGLINFSATPALNPGTYFFNIKFQDSAVPPVKITKTLSITLT